MHPERILLGIPLVFVVAVVGGLLLVLASLGRRATRFGYPSRAAYLRAAPRSDPEKRDAVDVTLQGLALCVLGLLFPPFVLVAVVPLYYGGRKLVYASMGLGLVDDPDA